MNNLSNLFNTEAQTVTGGANQLALTAQLTSDATTIADKVLALINDRGDDASLTVETCYSDANYLPLLVTNAIGDESLERDYFSETTKEDAIKMLKSQQSKKSRNKSAARTLTNFKTMVTATVAELILRANFDLGSSTSAGGGRKVDLILTDEMIEKYKNDQESLAKAIRNVQSKKSIAKSKADFDENSDDYQKLLSYEASLKSLRTGATAVDAKTLEQAEKAEKVEQLLSSVDPSTMKKAELEEAMKQIKEMMMSRI